MENTKSLFLYCTDCLTVESGSYGIRLADIRDIYTCLVGRQAIGVVYIW